MTPPKLKPNLHYVQTRVLKNGPRPRQKGIGRCRYQGVNTDNVIHRSYDKEQIVVNLHCDDHNQCRGPFTLCSNKGFKKPTAIN